MPADVRRLLDPAGFEPIHAPGPLDWLAVHPEPGQTFRQFLHSHPNFPEAGQRTLYLQPLEAFSTEGPALPKLKEFTEDFFALPVQVLPIMKAFGKITSRVNPQTGKKQLLTGDILEMLKQRVPRNAYCLLGITLHDLYPDPRWNFVFGEATLKDRVGIYSFARYDPKFIGEDPPDRDQLILRRSCKILAHETGHMFGIEHCIYFECVMNGTNHLAEDDLKPLHLCPVDLRKLYASIQFDMAARYAHLGDFCRKVSFNDEARWIEGQLRKVAAGPG
jgi:archaemetzincin